MQIGPKKFGNKVASDGKLVKSQEPRRMYAHVF